MTISSDTAAAPAGATGAGERTAPSAWYALVVFALVTLFAFVDRHIFSLLAEPIRKELGISDLQLGLLQGTGVAVFAAIAAYPLGWLADRYDRRVVLAGCVLFWSAAVAACGLAANFNQLLFASALVGAGEAGLVPIVFSLIPELFRTDRRQLANSIYAVSSQTGGPVAMAVCGVLIASVAAAHASLPAGLAHWSEWRLSFFAAALPAPLMVALIMTLPAPAVRRVVQRPTEQVDNRALLAYVRANRSTIVPFVLGIGCTMFGFASVAAWTPVLLMREYGFTAVQIGARWSVIALSAMAIGFVVATFLLRPLVSRVGPRVIVRVLGIGALTAACTYAVLPFTTSGDQVMIVHGITHALLAAASMLLPTALQGVAPGRFRARVVATNGIVSLVFGASAAPLVGALSDQLTGVHYGLMWAMTAAAVPALVAGGAFMFWCERTYAGVYAATEREDALARGAVPS